MLNLKDKNQLTDDEKRDLHMLHYDGCKRYAATLPYSPQIVANQRVVEIEDIGDVIACIRKVYADSIERCPSLLTEISEKGDEIKFGLFDNLEQEMIEISLSDINKFALISRILGISENSTKRKKSQQASTDHEN